MHPFRNSTFRRKISDTSFMIIIATCAMLLTFVAAVFMNSVQAQTTECVQLLDSPSAVNDSWDGSCLSENPPIGGKGERYARFFVFALETETEITIELSSPLTRMHTCMC